MIMLNETWKDEAYCKKCKRETDHQYTDGGHERDSSNDRRECLECGESVMGWQKEF